MEENLHGHVSYVQLRLAGMNVEDREDLLVVNSGLASDTFNKVLRARLNRANADTRIAGVIEQFRRADLPFAWLIEPGSTPFDLGRRLERCGLRRAETELGMEMDLAALPRAPEAPAALEIRRARTAAELADFTATDSPDPVLDDFYQRAAPVLLTESCPMRLYVGYLDGRPVATGELFAGGGVGGIYSISTREPFRRRGIGSLLTWTAASHARSLGMSRAVLQASPEGQGVYARLGFRACCRFIEYQ